MMLGSESPQVHGVPRSGNTRLRSAPSRAVRILIIVNPISGRGRGPARARQLARHLEIRGASVTIETTAATGDARRLARSAGSNVDVIVCAGGDGTLNEVVNGLEPGSPVALALLPSGTANVLAHDLRIPKRPARLAELIATGSHRKLDALDVNGRLCHLMVGVGFDAATLEILERRRRGPITKLSYLIPGLKAFWNVRGGMPPFDVAMDDQEPIRAHQVFATNVGMLGTTLMRFDHGGRPDDGLVDTYVAHRGGRLAILRYLFRLAFARLTRAGDVQFQRIRRMQIRSDAPVPYQVDGDFGGYLPIDVQVIPGHIHLICPKPS